MTGSCELDREIEQLKVQLKHAAEENQYNFHHPKVLELSEKLDKLIVKMMKEEPSYFGQPS
ncbi:aspartyl-phosphate phosphatase Spo0E family protein [Paenibacillus larvae]|uniref:Spo0E family sporulation regulatory protein-aspartic acid phosphatase n=3 Tax=Paenibacillus larvae TaxID=1464 RepID=A0A1V0UX60_9BACL|nr:aspartyl-phosphate phosphatase Spo0E family protein [Paenibacillus larvae]AQR77269.1 Spo0E family sporulation regulatory protein-aspartic acid phosphatase [Paenibacillus larvae subsp. larvae]ARF69756.1 Spo0E family sporulation regulatory protein-aspartic acid phosphatase [Paenibacillus larvae subsp. pulvifaciens]AVF21756.1 Spo0E like sporulation regulatory protein [Paenibacillus larvae subsp. larvae]AVG12713.1 Spo0E like sporulation regulatory protein [Paenibacillus larvae subsp. larvae DSM 